MSKKIKTISGWDWETLVASWRYFEYRHTISSASFPCDIIERFWTSGRYEDCALDTIAHQFAYIDHRDGESDWDKFKDDGFANIDYTPWKRLYRFMKSWDEDKWELVYAEPKEGKREQHICFEFDGKLIPLDAYISNPYVSCYMNPNFIKEVKHGVSRQRKNGGAE